MFFFLMFSLLILGQRPHGRSKDDPLQAPKRTPEAKHRPTGKVGSSGWQVWPSSLHFDHDLPSHLELADFGGWTKELMVETSQDPGSFGKTQNTKKQTGEETGKL